MKAVSFAAPIPRYLVTLAAGRLSSALYTGAHACTRYGDVPSPKLPGDDWVRIRTRLGGICGSDLAIVTLAASPSTSPFSSFPFVLGHESVGEVAEVGSRVTTVRAGDRVTVNPLLCCEARGIAPPCSSCTEGKHQRCIHLTDGALAPGMLIGTTNGLGGSWGEEMVAHQSQVVAMGAGVTDEEALLTEPLACGIHAVRTAHLKPDDRTLIVGAGSVGLLTLAAQRAVASNTTAVVVARHAFQAEHATRLGAAHVVQGRDKRAQRRQLAEHSNTRLLDPIIGDPIGIGGFDCTFVCIASAPAMEEAMRFTRAGGTIVVIGNVARLRGVDWTPLWIKELTMRGTVCYGAHGDSGNAFAESAGLINSRRVALRELVTHTFALADYRRALDTAMGKAGTGSVKVALRPS